MTKTAYVNYHVSSPEPQAFHIDAGGEKGMILSPELAPTKVPLTDLRSTDNTVSFQEDSLGLAYCPSSISEFNETDDWQAAYDQELRDLLVRQVAAREVLVFDHTLRVDDPDSDRRPARNVHSDYSPSGAHLRLRDLLGEEEASAWEAGHFGFINIWRPIKNVVNTAPLGFVRPSTVSADDWIKLQLVYPDRLGQIMGLVANAGHECIYLSRMTPDEVAYFNIYDNQGLPSIAHSALDYTEDESVRTQRMSLESRTLVRY